jgi:hypothetical protein
MELLFSLESEDKNWSVSEVRAFKNYIEFKGLSRMKVEQLRHALKPDEAGGLMDSVVKLFFGTDLFEKVTDIFKEWVSARADVLQAKKPTLSLEIKKDDGKSLTIRLENIRDVQDIMHAVNEINIG